MRRPAHRAVRRRTTHRTARQRAAAKKWSSAGRIAAAKARRARHGKLTPKQHAAVQKWHKAGLAARAAGKARKTTSHKTGLAQSVYDSPVCSVSAISAHLLLTQYVVATDADILWLYEMARGDHDGAYMGDVIEAIAVNGLAGWHIEDFWRTDPDSTAPGLIHVLKFPRGFHAVLALPGGDVSWGQVLPRERISVESWYIRWAG